MLTYTATGFLWLPPAARWSIVLVGRQHLDEYAGAEAVDWAIDYVLSSIRGGHLSIRDGRTTRAQPILDLSAVAVLAIPRANTWHWSTRCHGDLPGQGRYVRGGRRESLVGQPVTDINRTWPHGDLVRSYWQQITQMPGPVVVLDFHSTYKDRFDRHGQPWQKGAFGDGVVDAHLYATGRTREWIAPILPEWPVVDDPLGETPTGRSLDEAADAAGHYGITVEISEDDGTPAKAACSALARVVASGGPRASMDALTERR